MGKEQAKVILHFVRMSASASLSYRGNLKSSSLFQNDILSVVATRPHHDPW